jgi:RNA polymerase sigma-70 factor, ECF subfamily
VDRPDVGDVEAAAGGDVAAFERLVRAHHARVWRYLVHLLGDPTQAEDVAQEVFIKVHRRLRTLRDPERFVPWLLSVARNTAYDAGRSRKRRPLVLVDDDTLGRLGGSVDPHLDLEVEDALARLDDDMRESLVLVGMLGFSYQEAAGVVGVPEGTVKSRVFRARRMLMDLLDVGDIG